MSYGFLVSIMSQESHFDGKKIIYVQCNGIWIKSQDYGLKMNEFESQIVRITAQWTQISTKFKY